MSDWSGGFIEWTDSDTAYLSAVFSWQLQEVYQRAVWWKMLGYKVCAGGPAVILNPSFLDDIAQVGGNIDALPRHNPNATFTSRGCVRKCSFCAVPKLEGALTELDNWPIRPIICDNNLLACSVNHFDSVIDKLKRVPGVDFNQGLDARVLTKHHADRLAELDIKFIRLAWDHTKTEPLFMKAFETLVSAGIAKKNIRVYVLIGYGDTPEDALYRLETIRGLGIWPNPMRYQPLDTQKKNSYIDPNWTHRELKRYMRYFSRLVWLGHIPFSEYKG